jgi:anti-sigma B factor antagonist
MKLPIEIFGDVIVAHTPEELGAEQAEEFEEYLPSLERDNIVLDIDNTETLDSKGLAAILTAQDTLRDKGGEVKIAATNLINRKIFEITRLDEQLEVYSSVVDAVKSFH